MAKKRKLSDKAVSVLRRICNGEKLVYQRRGGRVYVGFMSARGRCHASCYTALLRRELIDEKPHFEGFSGGCAIAMKSGKDYLVKIDSEQ